MQRAFDKRQNANKLFNNERTFPIVFPRKSLRFILCTCLQISWACTQNIDELANDQTKSCIARKKLS